MQTSSDKDDKFDSNLAPAILEILFGHDGYKKVEQPKDLYKRLINIIEIDGIVQYSNQDKFGKIECKNNLGSNKVFYSEHIWDTKIKTSKKKK
jgi:hypothetical protein